MRSEPVSLYIPGRNAELTLADCIAAVRAQTRTPDEFFILADPRSTDRTLEIARKSGVRVFEQTGQTLGAARNQAIASATYRWIACCDSDVLIAPDWLEKLALRRSEGAAGIGGRTIERTLTPADEWRALHMPHHWGPHAFKNPFMLVSEVLFDRDALLAAGGYRDDLNYYEDSDLCQRLREAGFDLLYEPAAVAVHQRSDDLIGVLNLRWRYSEYRQRHLLDRYAGLLEKCRVNRGYAMNTLSRSLARGSEELAYISFLLFFHHLLMDLGSMLSRRPLMPEGARLSLQRQLLNCTIETVEARDRTTATWLRADLAPLCTSGSAVTKQTATAPTWPEHLAAVRTAVQQYCAQFGLDTMAIIDASARHCHGELDRQDVARLNPSSLDSLRQAVESLAIRPCVDARFCEAMRSCWPDVTGVRAAEAILDSEREALHRAFTRDELGPQVVWIAPHLEARPDPLSLIGEIDATAGRLVLSYQAPERFIPGLDVITPADLASAASGAGWTIERFETLVGRTQLMLSRNSGLSTSGEAPPLPVTEP